jgi:hypothetical protein
LLRDAPGILAGNSWIVEGLLVAGLVSHRRGSGKIGNSTTLPQISLCRPQPAALARFRARGKVFSALLLHRFAFTGIKLRASGVPNSSAATPLFPQIVDGNPRGRGPSGETVSIPEQHFAGSRSQATAGTP